jgi:hypothetical protein
MRARRGGWTDDELKQLAAIVASGGTPFRAALDSSAASKRVRIKRVIWARLSCRCPLGEGIFWKSARPLRRRWPDNDLHVKLSLGPACFSSRLFLSNGLVATRRASTKLVYFKFCVSTLILCPDFNAAIPVRRRCPAEDDHEI